MMVGGNSHYPYLRFTATEASTIALSQYGVTTNPKVQYSINQADFVDYTLGTQLSLADGDTIEWRRREDDFANTFSINDSRYIAFAITGNCVIDGYVTSLLRWDGKPYEIGSGAFCSIFATSRNVIGPINIAQGCTKIGFNSFNNTNGMSTINIPDSVTEIEGQAFQKTLDNYVGDFIFPDAIENIPGDLVSITNGVSNPNLGNLILPANLITVGNKSFNGCNFKGILTIPSGVTSIGNYAFNQGIWSSYFTACVWLPTTPPTVGTNVGGTSPTAKHYVPYSADHSILAAYKTAFSSIESKIYELNSDGTIPT